MSIDFTVPGKPVPNNTKSWYNPKLKRVLMYKPKKVKEYKNKINEALGVYMEERGLSPIRGAVVIYLYIYIEIPKSYSKKKREELLNGYELGYAPAMKKPDIDNLQKIVIDAISKDQWNKGAYLLENDSQICAIHAYKFYAKEAGIRIQAHKWGSLG